MEYSNSDLEKMTYAELKKVKPTEMIEHPPVLGLGFPHTVMYSCRFCGGRLEGSERAVKKVAKAKPVLCPYCKAMLWDPSGHNSLRTTAFKPGHFDLERRKRYLKYLIDRSK